MTNRIRTAADPTTDTAPGVFAARDAAVHRRTWRISIVGAAAVLALAVWTAAVPVAGLELVVGAGPAAQHVGPVSIVVTSLALGLVAWALLALLERLGGSTGRVVWRVAGLLVLIVSLAGPLAMGGALPVLLTLEAMHLAVGATVILGLAHRRRDA